MSTSGNFEPASVGAGTQGHSPDAVVPGACHTGKTGWQGHRTGGGSAPPPADKWHQKFMFAVR